MTQSWLRPLAFAGLATAMIMLSGTLSIEAEPTGSSPVLVELFTSQGCSSCPAADRLLSALAASNENIVTLAFHVDYWNYIGWTDPFSSADWSDRQRDYARAFGDGRIYTPQLVVNGRRHGVGSSQQEVAAMIRQAAGDEPAGQLKIEILESTADSVSVRLDSRLEAHSVGHDLIAWIAVTEDGLETPVGRGENARRTLFNDRVVRQLVRAAGLKGDATANTARIDIDLEPEWQRDRLSIAAFLQDPDSRLVVAAALVPLR